MQGDPPISFLRNGHEVFDASEFTVFDERPSAIAPRGFVKFVSGLRCPRCDIVGPSMQRGDTRRCEECGLNMALYGNGLECW